MKPYQEIETAKLPFLIHEKTDKVIPVTGLEAQEEEDLSPRGFLTVNVTFFPNSRPVENARVRLRKSNDASSEIMELSTDLSGKTPQVLLSAPPRNLSLEPSVIQPYSDYDCLVEKEGFESVEVNNFNIFEGEASVLNVNLLPLEAAPALPDDTSGQAVSPPEDVLSGVPNEIADTAELFVIPPHTLYGYYPPKIAESMIKTVEGTGEIVLNQVVIPEYIVVHDGPPTDSSAEDYYVPYKDYIKNVASSEIYSTWPEQTIIANVIAIQSFTLNRVYTEW